MDAEQPKVVVGVPTRGSAPGLPRLLDTLTEVVESATAHVEVAVVDNGSSDDARRIIQDAECGEEPSISYLVETETGIPFARNACIRAALERDADALVFVDDDEWPATGWLEALLATWRRTSADIVLGPVKGVLPAEAPAWARHSGVFDKDRALADGAPIRTAYSYNTLVNRRALQTLGPSFDPAFRYTGASDHHYFKQATAAGLRSVWSPNALVYEEVEPHRVRLSWVLKRGYRIGAGVTRSTRLRLGGAGAMGRIMLLSATNLGYTAWHVLRTVRHAGAWVEGLRRLGITIGLVAGTIHPYEEYGPSR